MCGIRYKKMFKVMIKSFHEQKTETETDRVRDMVTQEVYNTNFISCKSVLNKYIKTVFPLKDNKENK